MMKPSAYYMAQLTILTKFAVSSDIAQNQSPSLQDIISVHTSQDNVDQD